MLHDLKQALDKKRQSPGLMHREDSVVDFNNPDASLEKLSIAEKKDAGFVWDGEILPHSWYQIQILDGRKKRRHLHKIELLRKMDIYHISPAKLSRLLTSIDQHVLRKIAPNELVEYDGAESEMCTSIRHVLSKNVGLTNFVAHELAAHGNYRYFFRVMRHLKRAGNYNSFYCLFKAFQMQKLSLKRLTALSRHMEESQCYFDMRHVLDSLTAQDAFLICPLDIYIKDVEDSNRNRSNEIASMRFCRLVEILIRLQAQDTEIRISHDEEHFLLERFWTHLQKSISVEEESLCDGQFLLI